MRVKQVALKAKKKVARLTERGEVIGNLVLVSVTGWHEWPNEVGYACVPILVFLFIHLICGELISRREVADD